MTSSARPPAAAGATSTWTGVFPGMVLFALGLAALQLMLDRGAHAGPGAAPHDTLA